MAISFLRERERERNVIAICKKFFAAKITREQIVTLIVSGNRDNLEKSVLRRVKWVCL